MHGTPHLDGLLAEREAVLARFSTIDGSREPVDWELVEGRSEERSFARRVRRRRLWRKESGNPHAHRYSGDAGQEDRPAGDDADFARGGSFHRTRARRDGYGCSAW